MLKGSVRVARLAAVTWGELRTLKARDPRGSSADGEPKIARKEMMGPDLGQPILLPSKARIP